MEKNAESLKAELVEIRFLEGVSRRLADHEQVLKALGDLYTRAGLVNEGLVTDRKLVELCPEDPMVWYNLGCSLALTGKTSEALEALKQAVNLGYDDAHWMSRDDDLKSLREEFHFNRLLLRIKEKEETHHEE